jgi:hypothetical protein
LDFDPLRLVIKGYHRELTINIIRKEWAAISAHLPPDLVAAAVPDLRGFRSISFVDFPDKAKADAAFDTLFAVHHVWKDPINNTDKVIKAFRDRPVRARHTSRILGNLWKPVHKKLTEGGHMIEGCSLGSQRGKLWFVIRDIPFALFTVPLTMTLPVPRTPSPRILAIPTWKSTASTRHWPTTWHRHR